MSGHSMGMEDEERLMGGPRIEDHVSGVTHLA